VSKISFSAPRAGRQFSRHRIGVDVVGLARLIGSHAGDHRNLSTFQQGLQQLGVDAAHFPNKADLCPALGSRFDQVAIPPAQPHRRSAGQADELDDLLINLAHQHHLHYFHGGGIGNPQAIHKLEGNVQFL
jgi:hypothetical protein